MSLCFHDKDVAKACTDDIKVELCKCIAAYGSNSSSSIRAEVATAAGHGWRAKAALKKINRMGDQEFGVDSECLARMGALAPSIRPQVEAQVWKGLPCNRPIGRVSNESVCEMSLQEHKQLARISCNNG